MIIIYVDIILLIILLLLVIFTCGYCAYRVHRMQQNGQVAILLRPTKVLFSHRTEDNSEQLRTVVAYRNPFTGDYCVHKNREPKGYLNSTQSLASTDSGLSDEYEPLNLPPLPEDNSNMPGQVDSIDTDYRRCNVTRRCSFDRLPKRRRITRTPREQTTTA